MNYNNNNNSSSRISKLSLCVFLFKCLFFDFPSSSSVVAFTSPAPVLTKRTADIAGRIIISTPSSSTTTSKRFVATTPPPPSSWYNGTEVTEAPSKNKINDKRIITIRGSSTISSSSSSSLSEPTTTSPPSKGQGVVEIINENAAKRQRSFVRFANMLSLHSGFLNAIFLSGIVGKVQAVGPVTDSWTKFGLAVASNDVEKAFFVFRTLSSFGLGAMITGMLLTTPSSQQQSSTAAGNQQQQLFDLSTRKKPLLLASILLGLASSIVYKCIGSNNPVPAIAYMMVCMANGIQNSFTSTVSSNLCRTTHMTGTYTDVCTIIGQCIKGDTSRAYKLKIYGRLISAFWFGGILGGLFISKTTNMVANVPIALGLSSMFYLLSSLTPSSKSIGKRLRSLGRRLRHRDDLKP